MRYLIIILLLTGCSAGHQTLTMPGGQVYDAYIDKDTIVKLKTEEHDITFDRRGSPSMMENLLTLAGVKALDTQAVNIK